MERDVAETYSRGLLAGDVASVRIILESFCENLPGYRVCCKHVIMHRSYA